MKRQTYTRKKSQTQLLVHFARDVRLPKIDLVGEFECISFIAKNSLVVKCRHTVPIRIAIIINTRTISFLGKGEALVALILFDNALYQHKRLYLWFKILFD